MPSLSVRGLSVEAYEGLRELSARNHRSMQEQVRLLIEREVALAQPGILERAAAWRQRLAGRDFSHVLDQLRADRER